ncbi:MAG: hypothetical protein EOP04_11380 [Proteobacteria bacterium]|nr:MAG: hypothetical protein EOP04_11380 [Pseudomonadota bacterium]
MSIGVPALTVSDETVQARLLLKDANGILIPVEGHWQDGKLIVRFTREQLEADTSYSLTLNRGPLSGRYTVAGEYIVSFRTPKAAAAPHSGGFKEEKVVALPIPDGDSNGISSSLIIDFGEYKVSKSFQVNLSLKHAYTGDLRIILVSPTGTELLLHNLQGMSGKGLEGSFPKTYQSYEPLQRLVGENLSGTWTLKVMDTSKGDKGTLNSWGIEDSLSNP